MKSRSLRSTRSLKADAFTDSNSTGFDEMFHDACQKYNCSYTVHVVREQQKDDFLNNLKTEAPVKYKKITVTPRITSTLLLDEGTRTTTAATSTTEATVSPHALIIKAIYDNAQNLVEIILNKIRPVPRSLLQIIYYIVALHTNLTKISFPYCLLDPYGLHELNKVLSVSTITELNFDRTFLPCEYLKDLLDNENGAIKNLSLCGCGLNDEVCEEIASRLRFKQYAEKTLMVLNLSSNRISDEGAKHLGEALRSNRHLRYLNLADNRIADGGAVSIFNSLTEFPLTYDEVTDERKSVIEYLRAKRFLFMKYYNQGDALSIDDRFSKVNKIKKSSWSSMSNKANSKKEKDIRKKLLHPNSSDDNKKKADLITNEIMGPFVHPFAQSHTKYIEGQCYCLGNMVLCYLNLSYNNLKYHSIKKLASVMQYQKINKKPNLEVGLLKIVIDGNPLPIACTEYQLISDLARIAKTTVPYSDSKMPEISLKKSRVTLIKK